MPFTKLGLSSEILRALQDENYTKPTPIQEKVIPLVLKEQDIMARAQTGSGKS
ncbi:MAG: DEAD/DEAH box helicase, partial [Sulfurimonadaceae bacterium]